MATQTLITADDLLQMPDGGKRYELVEGELFETAPTGRDHGRITSRIDRRLGTYVEENGLGEVFTGEPGYYLARDPDTVRAPDVAFVSSERLSSEGSSRGFSDEHPDLIVEVVSPNDVATKVQTKTEQWLRHGARLVWLVYPDTRSVVVYRYLSDAHVLHEDDELSGDPVLPGFSCPVNDIF